MLKKFTIIFITLGIILTLHYFDSRQVNFANAAGPTEVISNITTPTTWTKENSPYIIRKTINVKSELTIEPGTIVKFDYHKANVLYIYKSINAVGVEDDKIIFTSIRDDSAGGDTNNDGGATQPAPGDWRWIYFYSSDQSVIEHSVVSYGSPSGVLMGAITINASDNVIIKNSEIKYSGYLGIFIYNSQPTIGNNIISNNSTGVFTWSSKVPTIINNSIFDNNFGASAYAGCSLNAINNWWGDNSGPHHPILNPEGKGNGVSNGVLFDPWTGQEEGSKPPTIEFLQQFKSDGETVLEAFETTAGETVVFKAQVNDSDGDQVKLQVELREVGQPFTGVDDGGILNSDFVLAGSEAATTSNILSNGEYHWQARAIDEQGAASEWQEFEVETMFPPSFDFIVKTVPLYTQNYSQYPSYDKTQKWFSKEYAFGKSGENYWCGSEIKDCGCAITSTVMTLRYYNIIDNVKGNDVNPKTINEWLKIAKDYKGDNIVGYCDGDFMFNVNEYARASSTKNLRITLNGKYNKNYKAYPDNNHQEIQEMLDDDMEMLRPVVMKVAGHFIVSTEKLVDTYRVNDPFWYNTKILNQEITPEEYNMPYDNYKRDYNNDYKGIRRFYALGDYNIYPFGIASLNFALGSPAELLVIDPLGRKLGKDNNIEYNEIPGGSYITEGIGNIETMTPSPDPSKSIWIPNPADGEYKIKVIGTGEGDYHFYSTVTDLEGNSKSNTFLGATNIGIETVYDLSYDPEDIEDSNIYIVDNKAPEAKIYFNTKTEKLVIIGTDDITATPTIAIEEKCIKKKWKKCFKKEYIYTITDEAKNTLKLWLEKYEYKQKILAKLKKIQYSNDEAIDLKVKATYIWKNKNDNYKFLSQTISSHKEFIINGRYKQNKDNTRIFGYDWEENNKIKETKNGIVIIKLNTDEGRVDYEY
ncbi:right-handed parallel beta-helix repeat-containing protein [Candidatus Parcubacteria bacterium]|nr:right-handed parallel beta-helix repeat-containing protein [Candidatus Parcubacteria bacterium]